MGKRIERRQMNERYSVLMSVYAKEKPEYLRAAMDSMFSQTVPPDDFVLVCDGPLTDGLDGVIGQMQAEHPALNVVRMAENGGLGRALNIGLTHCKNELVARMDSDDISFPDRCQRQLAVFAEHPELSVVGGIVDEFSDTVERINARRVVPETNEQIVRFAKRRSPFNHPTVMFKKADVIATGNYSGVRNMQDYYLWVEMLSKGYQGYNIQQPLVWMREDDELFRRRSGKGYAQLQLALLRHMRDIHFISYPQYLCSAVLRVGSACAPNWMREAAFKTLLRQRNEETVQPEE